MKISNVEKSICIIKFLIKKADWGSWMKKLLKLLESNGSNKGIDKIPIQDEYDDALKGEADLDRKVIKLGELNED